MSARAGRRSPEDLETMKACIRSEEFLREIEEILAEGKDVRITVDADGFVKTYSVTLERHGRFRRLSRNCSARDKNSE